MVRVFANGPGDLGSIPGQVIPKTQKMVLDASLFNTQHYKVRITGKVGQSWERSSTLPYTLVWQLSKRELSGHSQLRSPTTFKVLCHVPESDNIAHSSVWLSNHTQSEAMHMSAHQLSLYYQPH